jgi:dolichol-phosphate mannosyltransferase
MNTVSRSELALVIPVYNEEACIEAVIASWHDTLSELGIDFRMFILNDDSRDGTAACLRKFADHPRICVLTKPNTGHGPTILMGYHLAVDAADWVFQVDSDDEMSPMHFHELWDLRGSYQGLFGIRTNRLQSSGRKIISAVSRATVSMLYSAAVTDVNVPYRLIRSQPLKRIITQIPPDTFAPNIIISGALAAAGLPLYNHPIPHEGRKTGVVSIAKWNLWKAALRSLYQTIRCRPQA